MLVIGSTRNTEPDVRRFIGPIRDPSEFERWWDEETAVMQAPLRRRRPPDMGVGAYV